MDGNRFVPDAIARGAAAIVSALPGEAYPGTTWIQVPDEREALAVLAANFHGHPAKKLHAIGVTGTNGKTTTTYLIESILKAAGFPSAVFGTIEYRGPGLSISGRAHNAGGSGTAGTVRAGCRMADGSTPSWKCPRTPSN